MIMICGILGDALIELMCSRLKDMGNDYFFLDESQYPQKYRLSWELNRGEVSGFASSPERKISLSEVTGVYARYVNYKEDTPRTDLSATEKGYVDAELQSSVMQLLEVIPCTVVNRVRASTSNDSKVYQALLAQKFGFRTPKSLVTTDPGAVEKFYRDCNRKIIFKSLSSVRSIVRLLEEKDFERLPLLQNGPTQFQEWIDGTDYRVHVVGTETFATKIVSKAKDYRYARREGKSIEATSVEIPGNVSEACIEMTKRLGLELSGVDLRRTADGDWICFEVNPSPGFLFYEASTGQPISKAVANRLM